MTARVLKAPEVVVADEKTLAPAAVREAIEEAFRQGRSLGYAEGARALDNELRSLRTSLLRTLDDLRGHINATVQRDAATITALAVDLAGWFIDHKLHADPDLLDATLSAAIGRLADETDLVLELSPAIVDELGDDHGLGPVTLQADPSLATGDYRLSGSATVLERQWSETLAELAPSLAAAIDIHDHDDR